MHGSGADWSDADPVRAARARAASVRANVSFALLAFVIVVAVLAGLFGLAAVEMPPWANAMRGATTKSENSESTFFIYCCSFTFTRLASMPF